MFQLFAWHCRCNLQDTVDIKVIKKDHKICELDIELGLNIAGNFLAKPPKFD
jgi:hypothetical protein